MPIVNLNNQIMVRTKALKTASTFDKNVASQTTIMRLLYHGGKVLVKENKVFVQLSKGIKKYHVGFLDQQYTKLFTTEYRECNYQITGGIPLFQVVDGKDYFIHKKFGLNLEFKSHDVI